MIVGYRYLVDVLLAIHIGTLPILTTSELNMRLPVSGHAFPTVYKNLLDDSGLTVPDDVKEPEDALLLLTAILSDIIYIYRGVFRLRSTAAKPSHQPYQTLSLATEIDRQRLMIKKALEQWLQVFEHLMPRNIVAFYYFCQICLACPEIWRLPVLAKYPPSLHGQTDSTCNSNNEQSLVTEEAMEYAWRVLDNTTTQNSDSGNKCDYIWMPLVLFFSALVVWHRVTRRSSEISAKYGTVKMLAMFSRELEQLPWPCCSVMTQTLERLIAQNH